MSEQKSNVKKRNWAFILYPESAPENWKDILQQTGLQCCVSPLHTDTNPDETEKKPHYHVMLFYSGPTSYNVVAKITASLNGSIPKAVEQIKGYYRYLTHKDNPEKKQYDEADIIAINGFSIRDFIEMTTQEITKTLKEIFAFIRDNDLLEYSDLLDSLDKIDNDDWFFVATRCCTIPITSYLHSRRYKAEKEGNGKS